MIVTLLHSVVLERFGNILNAILEALHDVCRLEGNQQLDVLVMSDSTDLSEDEETEHDKRKRQVGNVDIKWRLTLGVHVKNKRY